MQRDYRWFDRWTVSAACFCLIAQLLYAFYAGAPFDVDGYQWWGNRFDFWWNHGPLETLRTPGYLLFVAINSWFSASENTIKIEQALMLTSCVFACSFLGNKLTGPRGARFSAWLFALYLPLWSYSSSLLTEALSITCLLWAWVLIAAQITDEKNKPDSAQIDSAGTIEASDKITFDPKKQIIIWAVAAFLLTVCVLIRPGMLAHSVVSALVMIFAQKHWRQRAKVVAVSAMIVVVLFAPWVRRNIEKTGQAQPLGNVGQLNMAYGLHLPYDKALGEMSAYDRDIRFFGNKREDGFGPAQARSIDVKQQLWQDIKERPAELLVSRFYAQAQLWGWPVTACDEEGVKEPVPYSLLFALHWVILLFGIAGIWLCRTHWVSRGVFGVIWGIALTHVLFHATPRFALPAMALLFVTAGAALHYLVARIQEKSKAATS